MALRAFEFLNLVIESLLVLFEIVRIGKVRMTLRTCPNLFLVSVRFLVPQQIAFFTERFMALRAFEHFENFTHNSAYSQVDAKLNCFER